MTESDFERLYAEHARDLYAFLVYRTGDSAMAEDIMADTFERVLRARNRFDPRRARPKTWIYAIALNRLRDLHRRGVAEERALEAVAPLPEPDDASPVATLVASRTDIASAVGALTPEQRVVIALRYGGGLTAPETARVLRLPLTTVQGREHRALRRLRDELD